MTSIFTCQGMSRGVNKKLTAVAMPRILQIVLLAALVLATSAAVSTPTAARWYTKPTWAIVPAFGVPTPRHEACYVMVDGKGYLIGGRGRKPVDVYDPVTRSWTEKSTPNADLHHMQCVAADSKVFIVSSWTGGFPEERNREDIYIYDTKADVWFTKAGLPEERSRGAAAAVYYKGKIYLTHGNRGGHGSQATSLGWMDAYDIYKDSWEINLPTAPHPRDHTGGVIVNDKLCVAGGRNGGEDDYFYKPTLPTDCFNFKSYKWETHANIPAGRAGAGYGVTCDGRMMVAGGEGDDKAFSDVDLFDGTKWISGPPLQEARHGSGVAVGSCECGLITIASGAENQGGAKELTSVETYFPDGDTTKRCA